MLDEKLNTGGVTPEEITASIVAEAANAAAKTVSEAAVAAAVLIAKENNMALTAIAVLQADMTNVKLQQASFEKEINKKVDNLKPEFEKIGCKLDELTLGRPTWTVALILGGLLSLCVGLITFVVTIV